MTLKTIQEIQYYLKSQGNYTEIDFTNLELKSSWSQDDGKKISGMANRSQDYPLFLIVGVDNKGIPLGKDKLWATQTEANISQHFNQYLDPVQTCKKIECVEYSQGKYAIVIEAMSLQTVVFWNKKPYKMSGTTCSEMNPEEVMELSVRYPSKLDFTGQEVKSTLNDLFVKKFITRIIDLNNTPTFKLLSEYSTEGALSHLKIIDKQVSRLLFGDTPYRVVFFNTDGTIDSQETFSGLFSILNGITWKRIEEWLDSKYGINANQMYPELAVKETFANAVAHAAYFSNDGDIIIEVYKEKLIISNLCLPESGFFANKWFSRSHNTVNKLLMETLRISKFVDELGRGKYLIYSDFLKNGKQPPEVQIEAAGRFNRWKTILHGQVIEGNYAKAYKAIKERYGENEKAQIAFSLILWRGHSVEEIKKYIDGDSLKKFSEIIKDYNGPVFYFEKENTFFLNRWMRLLIEEGQDSKTLSLYEEEILYKHAYKMSSYSKSVITPKLLREYGDMGNSSSAQTQSSILIRKWEKEGKVERLKKSGEYKFIAVESSKPQKTIEQLLQLNLSNPPTTS